MLIACPSCQRQLNVPDNAAGKQVRCPAPDCGTVFYVPAPAVSAPAPVMPSPAIKKPVGVPRPVAAPKPVAPPPGPAGAFDFGTGGAAGPVADFGFTEEGSEGGLSGIRLRTRLGRAAGWLNLAAAIMVLYTLFAIGVLVAIVVIYRQWGAIAGAACAPFILLPAPVVIFIGARMVSRGQRWGLGMTAAVLSLIVGGVSLLDALGFGVWGAILAYGLTLGAAHGGPAAEGVKFLLITSCSNAVLSALVTFASSFAGFVALRTLTNAEVKATFS